MTRRHVLHAAAAVVAVVWHRVSTIGAGRVAPAVAPLPQTLRRRQARGGRGD